MRPGLDDVVFDVVTVTLLCSGGTVGDVGTGGGLRCERDVLINCDASEMAYGGLLAVVGADFMVASNWRGRSGSEPSLLSFVVRGVLFDSSGEGDCDDGKGVSLLTAVLPIIE